MVKELPDLIHFDEPLLGFNEAMIMQGQGGPDVPEI